eukprot:TRINITY_DN510_c0_g1_i2.p1 TRINITY_DN510_c0_g1~~TRINITY_DN510_c0_g1_i2.p1  ORF type:complete len:267 (-),score=-24.94 TRINITY_DN510_c0_g1_i2:298-1098(-)
MTFFKRRLSQVHYIFRFDELVNIIISFMHMFLMCILFNIVKNNIKNYFKQARKFLKVSQNCGQYTWLCISIHILLKSSLERLSMFSITFQQFLQNFILGRISCQQRLCGQVCVDHDCWSEIRFTVFFEIRVIVMLQYVYHSHSVLCASQFLFQQDLACSIIKVQQFVVLTCIIYHLIWILYFIQPIKDSFTIFQHQQVFGRLSLAIPYQRCSICFYVLELRILYLYKFEVIVLTIFTANLQVQLFVVESTIYIYTYTVALYVYVRS